MRVSERALRALVMRARRSRKVYLRIWRSSDVNVSLLFFRRGATASRWIYDCSVTFFLFGRRIDSRCFLLARCEQAQHSQQINVFLHNPSSYVTVLRSSRMLRVNFTCFYLHRELCVSTCSPSPLVDHQVLERITET